MLELVKIVLDLVLIRDATRKGQMNWRIWAIAIGFVVFLYGTAIPSFVLYQDHPQYKWVFQAAVAADAVAFVWFMIWGVRRHFRLNGARKSDGSAT